MVLTNQQHQEIKDYIFDAPKYIETYNEVYDHVVNALEDKDEAYSTALLAKIISDDFGSFNQIKVQEELYQKQINQNQAKHFLNELTDSFKWQGLLANIANLMLCTCIYWSSTKSAFNTKPMMVAIFLCFILVNLYVYTKIWIRKRKHKKYSIFDNALGSLSTFGLFISVFVFYWFVSNDSLISVNQHSKVIILLTLYFFCSLYIRSFRKFYNQKIKILIA
eukprot:TRINITY_DN69594_c0_g1_i1.p1 TRINITY_DN69594_c0_g1~~TRINITY_DN69594_c0_g1_i1.p1  ORF type:complete len:221 (-),score=17.29 TRINITY_DN69594_c0_g1_i1:475-1137(-)